MLNTFITNLQIFGIGLSFGLAGPCLLFCTPVILVYIAGRSRGLARSLVDISAFLCGRFTAYVALGAIAGFSGALLRSVIEPGRAPALINPLAGAISMALGAIVLFRKAPEPCGCADGAGKIYGTGGLFALGFVLGVSPCAPLAALLLQIALMSNSAIDGAIYSASFGLGTALSGFIVIGSAAGLMKGLLDRYARSPAIATGFRIICASLLIGLGAWLILHDMVLRI